MIYSAIGIMSGSSLDGLDIVFADYTEIGGKWTFTIKEAVCHPYDADWQTRLCNARTLNAYDYQLLHTQFGHYIGKKVNAFIEANHLFHKVHLVASHGHTTFHEPAFGFTSQLGDGAAIAAETGLPVVSDLRAVDVALGGQGAPIVPIGEKFLFAEYDALLNIGGIANISIKENEKYVAYDVCPANRVLNMLVASMGKEFDENGALAASGKVDATLLNTLNNLDYYSITYPKSLSNNLGTDIILPLINSSSLRTEDKLRTYVEHIAIQVNRSLVDKRYAFVNSKLLITGGGAFNSFLVERIASLLSVWGMYVDVPESSIVNYKEALIMGFIGVLRWREEINTLSSVTGAQKDSIGGAMWIPR